MANRVERIKGLLLERKRRAWGALREDVYRKLGGEVHSQFTLPQDLEDLSVLDTIEDTGFAIAEIRREELTRLEEALRKVEEGRYGICSNCGSEIDDERLKVMPFADLCISCKSKEEEGAGKKPTL